MGLFIKNIRTDTRFMQNHTNYLLKPFNRVTSYIFKIQGTCFLLFNFFDLLKKKQVPFFDRSVLFPQAQLNIFNNVIYYLMNSI